MIYYTGVGSREIPDEMYAILQESAKELCTQYGYTVRTGCAIGSDQAFREAVPQNVVIYTPDNVRRYNNYHVAREIAQQIHPKWKNLRSEYVRKLHTRNVYQVLGCDLNTPSEFLLCYTNDGCVDGSKTSVDTGGTGQAIRIAHRFGVPIINIKSENWLDKLLEII